MDRYGNQPFPFRAGFVEHAGGGGPSDLLWVIFGIALALLLIAIVSVALDAYYRSQDGPRRFFKWLPPGGPPGFAPGGRALAVLDMRYARGELSRKDYLRAREDLGTPPDVDDEATTEVQVPPPGRKFRKS
jgi:uncharacterized membrane protein